MTSSHYRSLILIVTGIIITISCMYLYLNGIGEDSIRAIIRWTAKFSALFFLLAFGASSFFLLGSNTVTDSFIKHRAELGLSFATFHTFHLMALIWLQQFIHPVFTLAKTSSLIGGSLAYLFMYLMAATTFPKFRKKLSPSNWSRLHTIGSHWIWLIFFRSYFKQVVYQERGYIIFSLLVLVMILRLWKIATGRKYQLQK